MRFLAALLVAATLTSAAMAQTGGTTSSTAARPSPTIPGYSYEATAPVHEIGFDAKVKRDPNGNIIDDSANEAAKPVAQAVRNDRKLSGDAALFNKPAPAAAAKAKGPVTNAELLKQIEELKKPVPPARMVIQPGGVVKPYKK